MGVRSEHWFSDRGYRLEGDLLPPDNIGVRMGMQRCEIAGSHGTGMAALIFSMAPDAIVRSYAVGGDPLATLAAACSCAEVDIVVAAWGVEEEVARASSAPLAHSRIERCISVRVPERLEWPGALPGVAAIGPGTTWLTGPFHCPIFDRPFEGLSAAVALAAGFACILIERGAGPAEAVRRAANGAGPNWAPSERGHDA